eukprot:SAG11_NODE_219_length_12168_cov_5.600083_2_plen_83_part_00
MCSSAKKVRQEILKKAAVLKLFIMKGVFCFVFPEGGGILVGVFWREGGLLFFSDFYSRGPEARRTFFPSTKIHFQDRRTLNK